MRASIPLTALLFAIQPLLADTLPVQDPSETGPRLAAQVIGTYNAPPSNIITSKTTGGPVLGNGDIGVVVGGAADDLSLYLGKNDFFGVIRGGSMGVGRLNLKIPELKNATIYRLDEHVGNAHVTGSFSGWNDTGLSLDSWVSTAENILFIELKNSGKPPLTISGQIFDELGTPGNAATYSESGDTTALRVSPDSMDLELGNRTHNLGTQKPLSGVNTEYPFAGQLADFVLFDKCLPPSAIQNPPDSVSPYLSASLGTDGSSSGSVQRANGAAHGGAAVFHGQADDDLWLGSLLVPQRQFTLEEWVNADSLPPGVTYLASACRNPHARDAHGLAVALVAGKLTATLNSTTIAAPDSFPIHQWVHVAATYDGTTMALYMNGNAVGETKDFPTADQVMGADVYSIHFGDPKLPYQGCAPRGLMVQRVIGLKPELDHRALGITLEPGQGVTWTVSVVTDRQTEDYEMAAHRLVERLETAKMTELLQLHDQWWHNFWGKSFVQIPDTLIQNHWYTSLYLLACCSKASCPAPGLWGNFVTVPETAWNGDYTLNYNHQAPFWGALACNHPELADSFDTPLLEYMPRGRAIAAKRHEQGIYYYTHLIPSPGWNNGGATDNGQKISALFSTVNMVMRWRYYRDISYVKTVYPFLRATADYWDSALVLQDGLYVDPNDCAAEWKASDTPATTISFLHLLLPTMIELSSVLQVDQEKVPRWKEILAKLHPLPIVPAGPVDHLEVYKSPSQPGQKKVLDPTVTLEKLLGTEVVRDRMVIRNAVSGYGFPIPMINVYKDGHEGQSSPGMSSCQCVFPAWDIGIESNAEMRKAALDTITLAAEWCDFNDNCSFYPGAACAGYDSREILNNLHRLISDHAYASGMIREGGGGIQNFTVTPSALACMFIQSYQQNIHLFPDWPADQDASFGNLNACGGFLISSGMKAGKVSYVEIESLAGEACRLANPWANSSVKVTSSTGTASHLSGAVIGFPTQKNESVVLEPEN
jgi:hypothetical protein